MHGSLSPLDLLFGGGMMWCFTFTQCFWLIIFIVKCFMHFLGYG